MTCVCRRGAILLSVIILSRVGSGAATRAAPAEVTSKYIRAVISLSYPGFQSLSVDSLGKGNFLFMPLQPPQRPWFSMQVTRQGGWIEYRRAGARSAAPACWAIYVGTRQLWLKSHWSRDDQPKSLSVNFENRYCHATLLGLLNRDGSVRLPAVLNIPAQGSFRISAVPARGAALGYATTRWRGGGVNITFPGATRATPKVEYCWRVAAIFPELPGINTDPRFDGFRRDWLNIFQINPQARMLANNASSTSCAFCYYEYADIAAQTPSLASGFTALDMVRQTLDRVIAGAKTYGMRGRFSKCTSDTLPSLLIAAEDYVKGSGDHGWLTKNYRHLRAWANAMLSTDRNDNGLIKYWLSGDSDSWPKKSRNHPANWWDTIGFGYEDAYSNALAYRALRGMEQLARLSDHPAGLRRYRAAADKLKAVYFKTFFDPATGVLAGWRSADGQLHDYYFLWVNSIAIDYGLVPRDKANAIMNHLLAKMKQVGYTHFGLGLPGNLIPVANKDYVVRRHRAGWSTHGSNGFQIYENGGATGCFSYFTLAALYHLGRVKEADRILFAMLKSYDHGGFQGWGDNGRSRDWKAWNGTPHGYEGFLADNYYAFLSVLDRQAALDGAVRKSLQ